MLRIKFERLNRQLSQTCVATVANIVQPVISQIETGRLIPTPEQLDRLAVVFGINGENLLKDVVVKESLDELTEGEPVHE